MEVKFSLYVIASEESQITNYSVEFNERESHIEYLINFIFTSKRARELCDLFKIYSQSEFRNLSEKEIIKPLVKFGLSVIIGISENLLIYLPYNLDSKQIMELILILEEYKETNMNLPISRMNAEGMLVDIPEMSLEDTIKYLNQNPTNNETISRKLK